MYGWPRSRERKLVCISVLIYMYAYIYIYTVSHAINLSFCLWVGGISLTCERWFCSDLWCVGRFAVSLLRVQPWMVCGMDVWSGVGRVVWSVTKLRLDWYRGVFLLRQKHSETDTTNSHNTHNISLKIRLRCTPPCSKGMDRPLATSENDTVVCGMRNWKKIGGILPPYAQLLWCDSKKKYASEMHSPLSQMRGRAHPSASKTFTIVWYMRN